MSFEPPSWPCVGMETNLQRGKTQATPETGGTRSPSREGSPDAPRYLRSVPSRWPCWMAFGRPSPRAAQDRRSVCISETSHKTLARNSGSAVSFRRFALPFVLRDPCLFYVTLLARSAAVSGCLGRGLPADSSERSTEPTTLFPQIPRLSRRRQRHLYGGRTRPLAEGRRKLAAGRAFPRPSDLPRTFRGKMATFRGNSPFGARGNAISA